MYTILIIEDEPRVASLLMNGLEENGYQTMVAYDGLMGLRLFLTMSMAMMPTYSRDRLDMQMVLPTRLLNEPLPITGMGLQ